MNKNEVEELLISLGNEIGKDESEMRHYIDVIVKRNWYDRIHLLENITNEQWEAMNIPFRLVDMIRNKIKSTGNNSNESIQGNSGNENNKKNDEWPFEYLKPENLVISPSLYNSIESLNEIDKNSINEIVKMLFKIIDSIIREPKKGKIRRIRMNNSKFSSTIGKYKEAMNVLKSVGFTQVKMKTSDLLNNPDIDDNLEEEIIELPIAYISLLTDCHHLLVLFCKSRNLEYPELVSNDYISFKNEDQSPIKVIHFNPYISNISTTVTNLNKETNRKLMESAIKERYNIEVEIKKREKNIEKGISDEDNETVCSKPFVIHSSNIQKLDNITREIDLDSEEDIDIDDYFDNNDRQKVKDSILGKTPAFKSRNNEYLKSLLNKKIYSLSCIRVVFPDKYVLQLQFKPNQTTHDLIETVKSCLNPNIVTMKWFIYQSPPILKIIGDKNLSLLKAGFVPNAQLYFKVELPPDHVIKGNYLKCELMNNIENF